MLSRPAHARPWATIVFFAVATHASSSEADTQSEQDEVAKQRIRDVAVEKNMYIEAWWSAQLDEDAPPEYVARLCSRHESDEDEGVFLLIDSEKAYTLTFQVDGRTPWCRQGELNSGVALRVVPTGFDSSQREKATPRFRRTSQRYIEHWQGGHSSVEWVRIALRAGRPVLIGRVQKFRPHCSEDMSNEVVEYREDWDALRADMTTYRYHGYRTGRMLGRQRIRLVPWAQCGSPCAGLREDQLAGAGEIGFLGRSPISMGHETSRYVKLGGGRYPRPDEALQATLAHTDEQKPDARSQ